MNKRVILFSSLAVVLIAVLFLVFFKMGILGLVTYDGAGTSFCGATVTANSDFSANHICGAFQDGGQITSSVSLDCANYYLGGDATAVYGIKISANNVIVRRCNNIDQFNYLLDIDNTGSTIIDSILGTGLIKQARLASSISATFINVSFTDANVEVGASSDLKVKYYIRVRVNDSNGVISGATVRIYNETSGEGIITQTTDAQGFAMFNLSDRKIESGGTTNFRYIINASDGSNYGENRTFFFDDALNTGITYINISVGAVADTTPPGIVIINPLNKTYGVVDFPVIFNVTSDESSDVNFSIDNGAYNISMSAVGNRHNGTNTSLAEGAYVFRVFANDLLGNLNYSENRTFSVDLTAPNVSIVVPLAQNYTSSTVIVNISLMENGSCMYSANMGVTNYSMSANASYTGFNSTIVLSNGHYNLSAYCNNSVGNRNYSEMKVFNVSVPDTTSPAIVIVNPLNTSYGSFPLIFNITSDENASVNFTLDNGAHNITMSPNATFTSHNGTNTSLVAGAYVFRIFAQDVAGNMNHSENRTFSIDLTNPRVIISGPTATTYTTSSYSINVRLNEPGSCIYSSDGGVSNSSLTANSSATGFTGSETLSNGDFTFRAYCNDTAGNRNFSETISFVINYTASSGSSGGGGGGGGGGTETPVVPVNSSCVNECNAGVYCVGNAIQTCQKGSDGCYKIISKVTCNADQECKNAVCEEKNVSESAPAIEQVTDAVKNAFDGIVNSLSSISVPKPSNLFKIPGVDPVIVDVAVGTGAVAVAGGVGWIVWIIVLSSSLPFFLVKLRHYSVSIYDSGNYLQVFEKNKLNGKRLYQILQVLESNYGDKFIFASKNKEMIQYLTSKGFVEVRLDQPFVITGHFSNSSDMKKFDDAVRKSMSGFKKVIIFRSIEKASIFGAIRAWRRMQKSNKMIKRYEHG